MSLLASLLASIGGHWPLAVVALALIAFCALLPAPALAIGRWLVGTERGRYVLLLAALTGAWLWYRGALLAEGERRSEARAAQVAQAARDRLAHELVQGAIATLDAYIAGAQAMADIGAQLEKDHAAALRAKDRTIACLRDGSCQLRDHWACAVPAAEAGGTTAAGSGRDGDAERRNEGAGDLVQVGHLADDQLRACQATVTKYQEIGVLRPPAR